MYFEPDPKYFCIEEFFSKQTILTEVDSHNIWRLLDWRISWTISEMRKYFKKPFVINDYKWGGHNQYRGYRPIIELIDWEEYSRTGKLVPVFSSFTSQHNFGRAVDFKISGMLAAEVREDIVNNYLIAPRYKYITAIEDEVPWVHIDVRSWDVGTAGLFVF